TKIPAEFIETPVFRMGLAFNDSLVFVRRNGPLGLVFNFGPQPFWNDRPRQPIHPYAKIVQLTQMNIGADRARLETGEQLLRLRLDDDQGKYEAKCLLSDRTLPSLFGWPVFDLDNRVERILPRPF